MEWTAEPSLVFVVRVDVYVLVLLQATEVVILLARPDNALLDLFSRKLTTALALFHCPQLYLLAFGLVHHAAHRFVLVERLRVYLVKFFADVTLCLISITVLAHETLHHDHCLSLLVRLLFFVLVCTCTITSTSNTDRYRRILALLFRSILLQLCNCGFAFTFRGDFLD